MNTYIIWKRVNDRNIEDVNDVVGLFRGTYEEADELIDKLNAADPSVSVGIWGKPTYGYWRSEPDSITAANFKDFIMD